MEDTLRVRAAQRTSNKSIVLILVLMEDTLRGKNKYLEGFTMYCLNPCSNGRHSQSKKSSARRSKSRLNPCFNGRYSQSN